MPMFASKTKSAPPPPQEDWGVPAEATVLQAQAVAQPTVVTVPPGLAGGSSMVVCDPATEQQMQVTVPPGLQPGAQFQVQFPAAPVQAVSAPPAYAGEGHVVQVQGTVVHQSVGAVSSASRRCRGCGATFELDAKTNPASASAFRCKKCRGLSLWSFF